MKRVQTLIATLFDPRNVLLAALSIAVVGFFASYGEVQSVADRALALRQGPPEARNIQDFRPSRDTGPAGEVRLRGEVATDAAVTLELPEAPGQWVKLVPIYPVSDAGRALISERTPEEDAMFAAQLERRATEPEAAARAIGIVLVPLAGPDDASAAFAAAEIGRGRHGALVTLNGDLHEAGSLALVAYGAFAARGVPLSAGALTVVPYPKGRVAALAAPVESPGPHLLFLVAWTLAVTAALLKFAQDVGAIAQRRDDPLDDDIAFVPPPPAQHPKFAPIPSQGEILAADRVDAERSAPPHRLVQFLRKLGLLRNPRSRPGAEAP